MKVKDIKLKLNFKSIIEFERHTQKSFSEIDTFDDMLVLLYYLFITNNNIELSLDGFLVLLGDKKLSDKLFNKLTDIFNSITSTSINDDVKDTDKGDIKNVKISDTIGLLLAKGIDPHYILYEMDFNEFQLISKGIDRLIINDLEEKRLFSYINILPHIDSKKLKSPKDLLPFAWDEHNNKPKRSINLNINNKEDMNKILNVFNRNEQ